MVFLSIAISAALTAGCSRVPARMVASRPGQREAAARQAAASALPTLASEWPYSPGLSGATTLGVVFEEYPLSDAKASTLVSLLQGAMEGTRPADAWGAIIDHGALRGEIMGTAKSDGNWAFVGSSNSVGEVEGYAKAVVAASRGGSSPADDLGVVRGPYWSLLVCTRGGESQGVFFNLRGVGVGGSSEQQPELPTYKALTETETLEWVTRTEQWDQHTKPFR